MVAKSMSVQGRNPTCPVVDDGRNVYLEFRGPVAADLEFFDQDGWSLPGVSWARRRGPAAPGLLVGTGTGQLRRTEPPPPTRRRRRFPQGRTMSRRGLA
jgi:hypothetical protein